MTTSPHLSWGGLLALVQGRLTPSTRRRYENHLSGCAECDQRQHWVQGWIATPQERCEGADQLEEAKDLPCNEESPLIETYPELLLTALLPITDRPESSRLLSFESLFQHLTRCYACFSRYAAHARDAYPERK